MTRDWLTYTLDTRTPNDITDYIRTTTSTSLYYTPTISSGYRVNECKEEKKETMNLKDLEKEFSEKGITITSISSNSNSYVWDIEGYINADTYHKYNARFKNTNCPFKPTPKKIIFSGPATTIIWKDGTKTTVKCQCGDVWDNDVGIAMCYLKKMLGNKGNFNNIFREAMKVAEVPHKKEKLEEAK